MIPSLEGWPTKAKEPSSPHEVRLTPLDTNSVFQCLGDFVQIRAVCIFRENIKLQHLTTFKSGLGGLAVKCKGFSCVFLDILSMS